MPTRGGVPGPRTPWTKHIRDLLADGPKEREVVVLAAMKLVPPGVAYREAVRHREDMRKRYPKPTMPQRGHRSPDYKPGSSIAVQIGARNKINLAIGHALRDGFLRQFTIDGVAYLERGKPYTTEKKHDDAA